MNIKVLPQDLINKIAAGEVVERPASVVKELVENSLDAGATNVQVEIENGGINLIKITDDGSGMNKEDAELSIVQHATSKIGSQEDLFNIGSLGFRGEALASISSVSEFCLISKTSDSVAGTKVTVENGQVKTEQSGAADGTSVEIRNIFYNVPARQKYLKTAVTEFNHVVDLFLNYCLAYPEVTWKLIHNNKVVYQFPSARQFQRIADCLGDEVAGNLIEVDLKLNNVSVKGFIGKPQIARNNRKLQYLFVNQRPVNEYIVAKQIKQAYTTLLSKELHPVYILNLKIENEKIDVNVHPRKLEVRFSEPHIIYKTVYQVVAKALDDNDLGRQVPVEDMKKFIPVKQVLSSVQSRFPVSNIRIKKDFIQPSPEFKKASADFNKIMQQTADVEGLREGGESEPVLLSNSEEGISREPDKDFKILGQVQNSYIIVECAESLKIYDQHATSERVQYEKLKREWQIGKLASQKMLLPQNIELVPAEAQLLDSNFSLLNKLGFEVENFGNNTFAISAVPQVLARVDLKELVFQIVGELIEPVVVEDKISKPVDTILKMMACKSAIKFGDQLNELGMTALINDLECLENQYTCVHGRPCFLEYRFGELEKLFKRKK
ncbi:DNA mismatch repair endonuclease MutL [Candidatus Falkowbacteria bacterium]|jgi:DNA mismatch repair protein MutL|nr:DNA mismatch repair endonuclease MutL [Candidatus Falkowbacteria bacterium]MBT5502876.1 DNA mismatch repair endonuclease MutL [Candidatus Falkowbacteria bacterium]MBT6573760.1 DNA mismatch repair endonuclease MutL [Candidatus Falkowbacteria bacterium]MBT7349136.1 DNA mismatch repair endonuclease MutL [Candidatus Falkowbacteria bacterium]MBT7500088.1 DNA mismatch repair endonuclease MutL [Candidatus Falkowbacteria bacterium]